MKSGSITDNYRWPNSPHLSGNTMTIMQEKYTWSVYSVWLFDIHARKYIHCSSNRIARNVIVFFINAYLYK